MAESFSAFFDSKSISDTNGVDFVGKLPQHPRSCIARIYMFNSIAEDNFDREPGSSHFPETIL